jgi:hypothetical protein
MRAWTHPEMRARRRRRTPRMSFLQIERWLNVKERQMVAKRRFRSNAFATRLGFERRATRRPWRPIGKIVYVR